MLTLVFCHGWAFDASYWDNLRPHLKDFSHVMCDLGYGGPPFFPEARALSQPLVGIGHSLGFAKLVLSDLPFIGMVSLNGFLRFCSQENSQEGYLPSRIKAMVKDLKKDPKSLLKRFYKICGAAEHSLAGSLEREKLEEDLRSLITLDIETIWLKRGVPTLVLSAREDPLLSYNLMHHQFAHKPLTKMLEHPSKTHILGACEFAWCAAHIRHFLAHLPYDQATHHL